jgi:DNA damage-inducible protein 1
MVELVILTDSGAALCRLSFDPSATVQTLLAEVEAQYPRLRAAIKIIRNDARGTVFVLENAAPGALGISLHRARLTAPDATVETLVLSTKSSRLDGAVTTRLPTTTTTTTTSAANTQVPSSGASAGAEDVITARILRLFSGEAVAHNPAGVAAANADANASGYTAHLFDQLREAQQQPQQQRTSSSTTAAAAAAPASTGVPPAPVPALAAGMQDGSDFLDPDALSPEQAELQRRIYEQIQQAQIDENLRNALEYTPEVFAQVTMLYVPCTLNQIPLKAFVDSGAQKSFMSKATAEKCGLMRLVDKRMSGIAVGVGKQKILGRIHMALMNIGGMHIPMAFEVMEEQFMDIIIGLDQQKRHQMIIDLKDNCLTIGEMHVSFLPENEIPRQTSNADDAAAATAQAAPPSDMQPMPVIPQRRLSQQQQQQQVAQSNSSTPTTNTRASATSAPVASPIPAPTVTPVSSTNASPTSAPAAPAVAVDYSAAPQTEAEREVRVDSFMAFTGITDRAEARLLLEGVGWDADTAASLYFDAD